MNAMTGSYDAVRSLHGDYGNLIKNDFCYKRGMHLSVAQVLSGRAAAGTAVTVKGWVRTRRDSKAGFSFVNVSDGSSYHPVQVVAPSALGNYASEVQKL